MLAAAAGGDQNTMEPIDRPDPRYPGQTSRTYFCEGLFLSNAQVIRALEGRRCPDGRPPAIVDRFNAARSCASELVRVYERLEAERFEVSRLKHVTVRENFRGILQEQGFRGSGRLFLLQGEATKLRLSCWGVHVPQQDLDYLRRRRYWGFRALASPRGGPRIQQLLQDESGAMLANSPALTPASRYGNFQFSFGTQELLAAYSEQHCGGERPELRVLGTEAHTLEIVHWVLIHSPHCRDFHHLPKVMEAPLARGGNPTWAPESLSNLFLWNLQPTGPGYPPQPRYTSMVWNSAVYAFHLPGNSSLRLGARALLDSVTACETAQNPLGGHNSPILKHEKEKYVSKWQAQDIINSAKGDRY